MHSTKIATFSLLEGMLVYAGNMCRRLELYSHEVHESLDAVSQLVVFVDMRIVAVVQTDLEVLIFTPQDPFVQGGRE